MPLIHTKDQNAEFVDILRKALRVAMVYLEWAKHSDYFFYQKEPARQGPFTYYRLTGYRAVHPGANMHADYPIYIRVHRVGYCDVSYYTDHETHPDVAAYPPIRELDLHAVDFTRELERIFL